ncbi:MAG: membrane protein insertion efficiency factor YidD [Desulfosalsimonas sp.]
MVRRVNAVRAALLLGLFIIGAVGCSSAARVNRPVDADTGVINMALRAYRGPMDHLAAVRTGRCSMYPSCSHYAQEAIEKHGPAVGTMLACDRLIRCGRSESDYAPKVPVNGKWRYYDPLSINDFWFSGGKMPARD